MDSRAVVRMYVSSFAGIALAAAIAVTVRPASVAAAGMTVEIALMTATAAYWLMARAFVPRTSSRRLSSE